MSEVKCSGSGFSPFMWWLGFALIHWLGHVLFHGCLWHWLLSWVNW